MKEQLSIRDLLVSLEKQAAFHREQMAQHAENTGIASLVIRREERSASDEPGHANHGRGDQARKLGHPTDERGHGDRSGGDPAPCGSDPARSGGDGNRGLDDPNRGGVAELASRLIELEAAVRKRIFAPEALLLPNPAGSALVLRRTAGGRQASLMDQHEGDLLRRGGGELEQNAEDRFVLPGGRQLGADVHLGDQIPPAEELTADSIPRLDLDGEVHEPQDPLVSEEEARTIDSL
jgi:hypothetical protein